MAFVSDGDAGTGEEGRLRQYFLKTDPLPRLREAVRKLTSGRGH